MNIFFDVDDTLITWDVKLRPGVVEVFEQLRRDGHNLYLWSGYGPRWEVIRHYEAMRPHIIDCFWKPLYDHHERLDELGVPFCPDYVIDDHRQVVEAFGGTLVEPAGKYFFEDREMERVYANVQHYLKTGEHLPLPEA